MQSQQWATLSIYDHRRPAYRRALVLFDKAVIPVPTNVPPGSTLTAEEIEQMSADVDFLTAHGAAVRYDYEQAAYDEWRTSTLAEALALNVNREPIVDTRHMLVDWVNATPAGVPVIAVPVFDSVARVSRGVETLAQYNEAFMLEIGRRIPVPADDVPLADIVALRSAPRFQAALSRLHAWQQRTLPDILIESGTISATLAEKRRDEAMREFDDWVSAYRDLLVDTRWDKIETAFTVLFGVGGALAGGADHLLGLAGEGVAGAFGLRKLMRPAWKTVDAQDCATAGVVIEVERAFSTR